MSQENEKPLVNEDVLTATIIPAASESALQIFEKKEEKKEEKGVTTVTTVTTTTTTTVVEQHSSEEQQKVSSVSSAEVDKTAVFEKQNKKMIVLGSINDEPKKPAVAKQAKTRTISPRERRPSPRAQRNVETPMTEQTEDTAPLKVKKVSESLLKSTAARVKDVQVLEERKKEKEPGYVSPDRRKSLENTWTPSERLLRPTQARIMDVKEWENHKERAKFEDDIWWELRKPAETAKPKPNTPSKLFEPTASSTKQARTKYDPATAQAVEVESPVKEIHMPAKIDANSPLLKKTTAAKLNTWKQTEIVPEQPKVVCQYTTPSGPQHVQSKLTYDTKAAALNRWKSKEQLEREQEKAAHQPSPNSNGKKVKGVSPRLLELNESLKHSVKPKFEKTNVDPREQGWQTVRRTSIPTIEEMHDSLLRSNGSVISSHRGDSSGSAFTSMEHDEEGHHERENQLAPEHEQEEPEQESHEIQPEDDPIHHEVQETTTVEQVTVTLTQTIQTLAVN